MDQDLKRIASGLKLPQESRERIRAQIASCQDQKEDIPVKKVLLKTRGPRQERQSLRFYRHHPRRGPSLRSGEDYRK